MRVAAQLVLTFLVNASWQIALVSGFAIACDWLLRGTAASYRHGLWIAALVLAFALPLLGPARLIKSSQSPKPQTVKLANGPAFITWTYSPDLDSPEAPAPGAPTAVQPVQRYFQASGFHLGRLPATILVSLYGLFLLFRAGQLIRAWRRTKIIIQSAFACDFSAPVRSIIEKCQAAIGVRRVRILCSAEVPVPITVGVFSPLVILPARLLDDVDEEVLTSAIGHELVHVARRDYLANLIYEIIYLPLSFHPAAALLRRRIKQTRELCCDEIVAARLLRAETYARSLVRLIGAAPLGGRLAVDTTIGISEADILEVRIMSLLKRSKLTPRRKRILLIAAALLLAAPCVAATSFALTFDIDRQEPAMTPQASATLDRQKQEQLRDELKRAVSDLQEKAKTAPESQRAEIQARLLEVQRNLEIHEQLIKAYRDQKQAGEEHLRELLAQMEKSQPRNENQLREMRETLARMDKLNTPEQLLEVQKTITEMERLQANHKARAIYRVDPEYPADAKEKRITGTVLLSLTIDHEGKPQNVQVKRSLYPSLDQAAVDCVKKWRFEPAMKDGQPVSMWINVDVYFGEGGNPEAQKQIEELVKREAAERGNNIGYANSGQELELRRKREMDDQGREERARRQAELTRGATLSMDRAIQIATSQVPGKVLACSLGRDGDKLFYHVVIITGDGDKSTATYVWVSAVDGQILKTEKEERREREEGALLLRDPGSTISGGVLNSKATSMPAPVYPVIARAAHASGDVTVEVTVDETGKVIMAHAVAGHPLLQAAAVNAARQATFTPTRLNGEPVKVSGALVYNFVTQ
jgi:TonB family protein